MTRSDRFVVSAANDASASDRIVTRTDRPEGSAALIAFAGFATTLQMVAL